MITMCHRFERPVLDMCDGFWYEAKSTVNDCMNIKNVTMYAGKIPHTI